MSVNHVARIVPVIKVNNRNLNQDFYSKTLGMKSLLEEGAQLSLGDQTKTERLIQACALVELKGQKNWLA